MIILKQSKIISLWGHWYGREKLAKFAFVIGGKFILAKVLQLSYSTLTLADKYSFANKRQSVK